MNKYRFHNLLLASIATVLSIIQIRSGSYVLAAIWGACSIAFDIDLYMDKSKSIDILKKSGLNKTLFGLLSVNVYFLTIFALMIREWKLAFVGLLQFVFSIIVYNIIKERSVK